MGVRIAVRQAVHPVFSDARSGGPDEYFYANEAVEVLHIEGIEYQQLRTLLALVRNVPERSLGSAWARYTLADIAGLHVAIELVGGPAVFLPGRRMRLAPLIAAISALRNMGINHPLIEVPLALHEGRVVARVQGLVVDPRSGQGLLGDIHDLLRARIPEGPNYKESVRRLRTDLARLRKVPTRVGREGTVTP